MAEQEVKLQQEIRTDAERKARRIAERAEREAEKLLEGARQDFATSREQRLAEARRNAGEQATAIHAGIVAESRRRRLQARESVLAAATREALEQVAALPVDRQRASLQALCEDAMRRIGHAEVVFRAPAAAAELLSGGVAAAAVKAVFPDAAQGDWSVVVDSAGGEGVVVVSRDGRLRVDNRYSERYRRLADGLRVAALEILEGAEVNVSGTDSEHE